METLHNKYKHNNIQLWTCFAEPVIRRCTCQINFMLIPDYDTLYILVDITWDYTIPATAHHSCTSLLEHFILTKWPFIHFNNMTTYMWRCYLVTVIRIITIHKYTYLVYVHFTSSFVLWLFYCQLVHVPFIIPFSLWILMQHN